MKSITSLIKSIPVVKRLRVRKWKNFSRRMMFSDEEMNLIRKSPESVNSVIDKHIANNPFVSKDIKTEVDDLISRSYLSSISDQKRPVLKYDMLLWHFAYGYSLKEYLLYRFNERSVSERHTFISDRDTVIMGYDFNDINKITVFNDKMNTYNMFNKYYKRECISLENVNDYEVFLNYINKHKRFVKKQVNKACGDSVELIDLDTIQDPDHLFKVFISEGKVILEEAVIQSDITKVFNDSSVNTIRCITFNTRNGIVVPFCFMKMGRKGSFVDNGGAGGVMIGVNPMTGMLETDGVDEFGFRYTHHPDSGILIKGFQLPEWNNMIQICCEMSSRLPEVHMIGWDMAYTDKGWVVIEGNSMTEAVGPQGTYQIGIRNRINELYDLM